MFNNFVQHELFSHSFQPIFDIQTWTRIGFEGLLRTSYFENIDDTFKLAKIEKQLYELDSRSIRKAALTYYSAGFTKKDGYLFLNVYPSTLTNRNFLPFIRKTIAENTHFNTQVIFEISEMEVITDFSSLKNNINQLRSEGFLFAIDDVGKGNSNVKHIIELDPDFIKLDKYFSNNLYKDLKKQEFIKSIIHYTNNYEINLVLEGIETEVDLAMAKAIGVKYGQGFVLGRPKSLTVV
ncbi:EAL domain-containing protein [Ferdinandcohnia sp. SAFN-114]|uniref:EAL domain-containing protein n=1 Tax=Ferdinandcohnia sp. SAFN-114 TaxID=3387275 RepID=UPI003F7DC5B9